MADAPKAEKSTTLYLTILDGQENVTGVLIVRPVPGDDRGRKEMVIFSSGHPEPVSVLFAPEDVPALIEGLQGVR
jgi:hypothetical protein